MKIAFDVKYSKDQESSWNGLLKMGVGSGETLACSLNVNVEEINKVIPVYPMRINHYFLHLMAQKGSSLIRQVVPDIKELQDQTGWIDPLGEEKNSPVINLIHRYPDRVLFLVSNECGVYCRFCTRKRWVGKMGLIQSETIKTGLQYIREHGEIRDVLVSGGDPLILSDERLEWILRGIREIPHVEIIRIGSRIPGVLPQRITLELVQVIQRVHPVYMSLHFNHPDEITDEVQRACGRLADGGIPMGSQTVLLKGINDDPLILKNLMMKLLSMRIRPYYLLQGDLTRGTGHFRTRIETGIDILSQLQGYMTGLAVPRYMIDLPGGGGKVPLVPNYLVSLNNQNAVFKNYRGEIYEYPQPN